MMGVARIFTVSGLWMHGLGKMWKRMGGEIVIEMAFDGGLL